MTRRTIAIAAVLIVLTAGAVTALLLSGGVVPADVLEAMRESRDAWWMIPAYIAAYAALDVLFIPTQALSIAAPLLWGWKRGGLIELTAATIGAIFPYLIARSTLRRWAARKLHGSAEPGHMPRHPLLHEIGEVLEREGFTFLLLLRLVPIIPYTPLNYLAGLSSVRLVQYVIATLIGTIPSTFIFAYFVQAVAEGVMRPREVVLRVLAAGTVLGVLLIATRMAAPRLRRWMHARRTASRPDAADRDSGSPVPPQG